jgi:serine/threonine protein kinase
MPPLDSQADSRDLWDDPAPVASSDEVSRIAIVLDEYAHLRGIGQRPERGEFLARHAALADELADCLDGLELVLSAQDDLLGPDEPEDPSDEILSPSTQLGDYRVIREVGRGGMGVVYEAEQLPLGRRVALKVLPSAASLDSRQRQRFQLEAQAVALLQHENIVAVYGVGCDQGVSYYAMQFIDGRSLAEIIREFRAADRAERAGLPDGRRLGAESTPSDECRTVAWYGVQAAQALQHAHDAGVIHRDIKPSNLMVDARGHLWVTDFGLARLPHDDPSLTRTGDLVGTLRYMSPEQVRGDGPAIDASTDIYALGLTLYELLALRPAFIAADRQELLRRILQDEPVAPRRINPWIPRDLETIVLKAIAKERQARYGSARELADDLARFLDDQPIRARRPSLRERTSRWSRRHRPVVVTAATVVVLALSISTALLWQAKRRTDAALESHQAALGEQRKAFESFFGMIDLMMRAMSNEAGGSEPRRGPEADQAYLYAIDCCDKIVKTPLQDQLVSELIAKASRRAGFFRMILGQPKGREDYERAIGTYGALIQRHPDFIWLRTGLIETLREYSDRLSRSGDPTAAEPLVRRALQVAEDLVGNKAAAPPCFHMALIDPFNGLAWTLVARPASSPSDTALAVRLARQAVDWEAGHPPPSTAGTVHASIRTPGLPAPRTTLGVALHRAGDWAAAASALEESMARNGAGDPRDWLFLAIVRQRQGHAVAARRWFERAVGWMDQNRTAARNPELCRFRAEAEEVLGREPVITRTDPRDARPHPTRADAEPRGAKD